MEKKFKSHCSKNLDRNSKKSSREKMYLIKKLLFTDVKIISYFKIHLKDISIVAY